VNVQADLPRESPRHRICGFGFQNPAGASPITPPFDPGYAFWIETSIEPLSRCDAMFLVPSWQQSSGARRELQFARERGIPVFEDLETLTNWITQAENS
jgi:hypothetical protein